jgi:hypothetical protein
MAEARGNDRIPPLENGDRLTRAEFEPLSKGRVPEHIIGSATTHIQNAHFQRGTCRVPVRAFTAGRDFQDVALVPDDRHDQETLRRIQEDSRIPSLALGDNRDL